MTEQDSWLSKQGRMLRGSRGFTLVELMIVILVIAILVSIAVMVFLDSRRKYADSVRLANMRILQDVLPRYCFDNGNFPPNTDNDWSGWDGDIDGVWIQTLVNDGYLKKAIKDPKNPAGGHASGNMHYYRYSPGAYGADAARGYYCVFGVRDMETSGRPHPKSPGWRTPGRNWQNEFDWVDGYYQDP